MASSNLRELPTHQSEPDEGSDMDVSDSDDGAYDQHTSAQDYADAAPIYQNFSHQQAPRAQKSNRDYYSSYNTNSNTIPHQFYMNQAQQGINNNTLYYQKQHNSNNDNRPYFSSQQHMAAYNHLQSGNNDYLARSSIANLCNGNDKVDAGSDSEDSFHTAASSLNDLIADESNNHIEANDQNSTEKTLYPPSSPVSSSFFQTKADSGKQEEPQQQQQVENINTFSNQKLEELIHEKRTLEQKIGNNDEIIRIWKSETKNLTEELKNIGLKVLEIKARNSLRKTLNKPESAKGKNKSKKRKVEYAEDLEYIAGAINNGKSYNGDGDGEQLEANIDSQSRIEESHSSNSSQNATEGGDVEMKDRTEEENSIADKQKEVVAVNPVAIDSVGKPQEQPNPKSLIEQVNNESSNEEKRIRRKCRQAFRWHPIYVAEMKYKLLHHYDYLKSNHVLTIEQKSYLSVLLENLQKYAGDNFYIAERDKDTKLQSEALAGIKRAQTHRESLGPEFFVPETNHFEYNDLNRNFVKILDKVLKMTGIAFPYKYQSGTRCRNLNSFQGCTQQQLLTKPAACRSSNYHPIPAFSNSFASKINFNNVEMKLSLAQQESKKALKKVREQKLAKRKSMLDLKQQEFEQEKNNSNDGNSKKKAKQTTAAQRKMAIQNRANIRQENSTNGTNSSFSNVKFENIDDPTAAILEDAQKTRSMTERRRSEDKIPSGGPSFSSDHAILDHLKLAYVNPSSPPAKKNADSAVLQANTKNNDHNSKVQTSSLTHPSQTPIVKHENKTALPPTSSTKAPNTSNSTAVNEGIKSINLESSTNKKHHPAQTAESSTPASQTTAPTSTNIKNKTSKNPKTSSSPSARTLSKAGFLQNYEGYDKSIVLSNTVPKVEIPTVPSTAAFQPYRSVLGQMGISSSAASSQTGESSTKANKKNKEKQTRPQPPVNTNLGKKQSKLCYAESAGGVCQVKNCPYAHFADYLQ